jgi:anion-transporting  ArsA/GET3 family ATPase
MDALLAKDLIVVTGKGGTGKTTVAGAIALAAARRGQRVVVAEVAARDDLARALAGAGAEPFDEREVRPGLHHVSVDPEYAMEEYLVDQLPSKALAAVLVRSRMFTYLAAATPGLRELLTMGKVWELAQPTRRTPNASPYDLVVLDAPATGHGLALLDAPRTFADAARVGPIARQGRTIQQMLTDPSRTGVVAVTTPEELPVNETLALRDGLRDGVGLELDAVVLNAVLPDRLSSPEARELAGALAAAPAGGARRRALHVAGHHHRRRRAQQAQTRRLRTALDGGAPVLTLPFLFTAELGAADLDALSERLA